MHQSRLQPATLNLEKSLSTHIPYLRTFSTFRASAPVLTFDRLEATDLCPAPRKIFSIRVIPENLPPLDRLQIVAGESAPAQTSVGL
jgi:hypothetical protein